jgi:hypothetical protein
MDDLQRKIEVSFRGFKQQRMPMIGGGHHHPSSTNLSSSMSNPLAGGGMGATTGMGGHSLGGGMN